MAVRISLETLVNEGTKLLPHQSSEAFAYVFSTDNSSRRLPRIKQTSHQDCSSLRKYWSQHTQLWQALMWQQQPWQTWGLKLHSAGSLQVVLGLLWSETAGYEMELLFCLSGPHLLQKYVPDWDTKVNLKYIASNSNVMNIKLWWG